MNFSYEENFKVISDRDFPGKIAEIEKDFSSRMVTGFFDGVDSKKIYYEYILAEKSIGSVVIVHGLSEFTKKFYEMTYYFLNKGYNVFLYDQRCHGLSDRLTNRVDLIHVDCFNDYVDDLNTFIEEIVTKTTDKPIYLFSHSMGGAVSLLYLAKNTKRVEKAVLSSPLIKPKSLGYPFFVARFCLKSSIVLLGPKYKFKYSGEFNPAYPFEKSQDACQNRFTHNMNMRISNTMYRSTPYTLGWTYNTLLLKKFFTNKNFANSIKTPTLILSSENDTVVSNSAQQDFADICKVCQIKTIKNAKHSAFSGKSETIKEFMDEIFAFYSA